MHTKQRLVYFHPAIFLERAQYKWAKWRFYIKTRKIWLHSSIVGRRRGAGAGVGRGGAGAARGKRYAVSSYLVARRSRRVTCPMWQDLINNQTCVSLCIVVTWLQVIEWWCCDVLRWTLDCLFNYHCV